MSSGSEAENHAVAGATSQGRKRHRTNQACDMCKQRKSRCERSPKGGKCVHCGEYNLDCSYTNAQKKYPSGYVVALETKVKQLEALVAELRPGEDFSHRVGKSLTRRNWMQSGVLGTVDTAHSDAPPSTPRLPDVDPNSMNPDEKEEGLNDEPDIISKLADLVIDHKRIHLANFYGSSSSRRLIATALNLHNGIGSAPRIDYRIYFLRSLRPAFWCERPWEQVYERKRTPVYHFPSHDLLSSLVELYFANMNIYLPILHHQIFEDELRQCLHLRDAEFGAVVLLVCAIGARLSNDPRVLTEGSADDWHSAGFKWFSQIIRFGDTLAPSINVHQLQAVTLACIYLKGRSEVPAWTLAGLGIRLAQNIGLHRRTVYGETPTVSDELFKRCFWSLVLHDRWLSANLGRSTAIAEEDFDVELPIDCDDEYWTPEDPALAFKQPEGKPSRISAFISIIKLSHIVSSALRTIHAGRKAKLFHGFVGVAWEEKAIAYHDAALNQWAESLPEHLRWDPEAKERLQLLQTAFVHSQYHEVRIIVHRPFISTRRANTMPYPSLAICLNAARNCTRTLDVARKRYPGGLPLSWTCSFAAGVILLYQIVLAKRSRAGVSDEDLTDARSCIEFLRDMETRSLSAGRVRDILGLMSPLGNGGASVPGESVVVGKKRARDPDPTGAPEASSVNTAAHIEAGERNIAQPYYATGYMAQQENAAYPLPSADVASTAAYTVPISDRTLWSDLAFATAANSTNIIPNPEPYDDGAALAALFGYQVPVENPSDATEPSIDPWAFALGSTGVPSQPSLSDTQADVLNLFGGSSQDASSGANSANWDWRSLLDGTPTSFPDYNGATY